MIDKIYDFWMNNFSNIFTDFDTKFTEFIYKKEFRKLIKELKNDIK